MKTYENWEQTYKGSDDLARYGEHSDDNMREYSERAKRQEAERRSRTKRRRKIARIKRKVFGIFFTVILILCVLIIILKTPFFSVKELIIEGNASVSEETIAAVSGLGTGESIFGHSADYSERSLEALPFISEAKVEKKFPSTVKITVTELAASYSLRLETRNVLIDKNGKSIMEAQGGEDSGFPVITGGSDGGFKMGEYVRLNDENMTENLMRCLSCADYYGFTDISEINISDEYNIYFIINGTLKIKIGSLGSDDELSYKMAYIKEVMEKLPGNLKGVIDATNPNSGVSYRSEESTYQEEKTEGEETEEEKEDGDGTDGENL